MGRGVPAQLGALGLGGWKERSHTKRGAGGAWALKIFKRLGSTEKSAARLQGRGVGWPPPQPHGEQGYRVLPRSPPLLLRRLGAGIRAVLALFSIFSLGFCRRSTARRRAGIGGEGWGAQARVAKARRRGPPRKLGAWGVNRHLNKKIPTNSFFLFVLAKEKKKLKKKKSRSVCSALLWKHPVP